LVREHFGDVILPVDASEPLEMVVLQVCEHLDWINQHPCQAAEMARQAHTIFREKFCLERLFERLPDFVERVREVSGYRENRRPLTVQTEQSCGRGEIAFARRYQYLPQGPSSTIGVLTAPPAMLDNGDVEDGHGLSTVVARPSLEYIICISETPARQIDRCLQ